MSNTKLIAISIGVLIVIVFLLSRKACKQYRAVGPEMDPTEKAENKNEETFMTKADEKDAKFMVIATELSLKEIKMAQYALANFRFPEVKDLADMMLADHTKALNEIKDLALKKEITIPEVINESGEEEYAALASKKGRELDIAYCDQLITNHEGYVNIFEKVSKEAADVEIRDWALHTLATYRDHVDFSKTCRKKLDKLEKI